MSSSSVRATSASPAPSSSSDIAFLSQNVDLHLQHTLVTAHKHSAFANFIQSNWAGVNTRKLHKKERGKATRMQFQREYLRGARQKARQTRDYFDDDDDDVAELDIAHGSSAPVRGQPPSSAGGSGAQAEGGGDDDEIDPLDAFMSGIEAQVVKQQDAPSAPPKVLCVCFL